MQRANSDQNAPESAENPIESEPSTPPKPALIDDDCNSNVEDEAVLDVSGKILEVSSLESSNDDVEGLYLYKNVFNVIPKSMGGFFFWHIILRKLEGLKELELSKVPPRPSAFPILSEIAGLKCLTKLSVCHFSIR